MSATAAKTATLIDVNDDLLRTAAGGDAQALAKIVRDLAPSVYGYQLGMLGDEREAEDAMQETFVRLARAAGRYEDGTEPVGWVFAIARRVAADLRPTPSAPPSQPPTGDGTEWVRRALRALPIELREILVLKEMMRWEPDRIASALTISTNDVEGRLLTAKTTLAETVGAQP